MSKKKEEIEEEEEEDEEEKDVNFKHWLSRVIFLTIIMSGLIYAIEYYFNVPLLIDILILITSSLLIFFLHEYLHYYVAVNLGYKPRWYRTRFTMGFEIDHHTKRSIWVDHKKKIGIAPYCACVPISIVLIILGNSYGINGLIYGGLLSLVTHAISFPFEGRNV